MKRNDIESLLCAIADGRVSDSLSLEATLYLSTVKSTESEEHYQACFDQWSGPMQDLGRKNSGTPASGPNVGIFLHSNSQLAHFQLIKQLVAHRERRVTLFVLADKTNLGEVCGVNACALGKDPEQAFSNLRNEMTRRQCGTLLWPSVPLYASYALASRIAERQVFWAMRFHPVTMPEIDQYITPGYRGERERQYHGVTWACAHAPINITPQEVNVFAAENYRAQFGFKNIIGTVAREEKIANPDYLQCVAEVLKQEPDTLFLWTGKQERKDIREFFASQGLSRNHRFLGWVEPDKCIELMDVFLETFPGGTMTWLAMARGVPVVGMKHPHAVYGWLQDAPKGACMADGVMDYAQLVLSVLRGSERRKAAVDAGLSIYHSEVSNIPADCKRMWELVCG